MERAGDVVVVGYHHLSEEGGVQIRCWYKTGLRKQDSIIEIVQSLERGEVSSKM